MHGADTVSPHSRLCGYGEGWGLGNNLGTVHCRDVVIRATTTSGLSETSLFGLFDGLRDLDLEVFFREFWILFAKPFNSLFGGGLDLFFVALVGVVEERAVADLAATGWVVEVVVVLDGLGADVTM